MAFTLQITRARQCAVGLAPKGGTYTLVVDDCLQASVAGVMQDVLVGRADQRLWQPVAPGHPMLAAAEIVALIRQDAQAVLGGQPDKVYVDGTAY